MLLQTGGPVFAGETPSVLGFGHTAFQTMTLVVNMKIIFVQRVGGQCRVLFVAACGVLLLLLLLLSGTLCGRREYYFVVQRVIGKCVVRRSFDDADVLPLLLLLPSTVAVVGTLFEHIGTCSGASLSEYCSTFPKAEKTGWTFRPPLPPGENSKREYPCVATGGWFCDAVWDWGSIAVRT